jgi:hypothetical protein
MMLKEGVTTMVVHKVVMVMFLYGADGSVASGIVPYKDYNSCWASLKYEVDTTRYIGSERVCMSAQSLDMIYIKKPQVGGPKTNWSPP